ncbi:MAG TPA: hypothetical protein PLE19_12685 [Planctomycetota bacterium]|nr:hypothetical protein [Planctomycetota bacterium]HRT95529.1 hypothetical protein [Planctomycetota bacterium]
MDTAGLGDAIRQQEKRLVEAQAQVEQHAANLNAALGARQMAETVLCDLRALKARLELEPDVGAADE